MTDLRSRSDALSELDPAARRRVRIGGLIAALATAVAIAGAVWAPPLGTLRPSTEAATPSLPASQWLFDLFQRLSGGAVSPQVQVVEIDQKSLAAYGAWPWSRFDIEDLVRAIAAQRPAAIGFDLMFPEPDRLTADFLASHYPKLPKAAIEPFRQEESGADATFGATLGKTPSVLARAGTTIAAQNTPLPPFAQFEGTAPASVPVYAKTVANIQVLENRAAGHGLVNAPRDRDGVVRSVPLLGRASGYLTPSLALEMVRIAEGEPPIVLHTDRHGMRAIGVGKHLVPTMPGGQLRLRFRDVMQTQVTSPVDIAQHRVAPDQFTGKIVLIGLTSAGTTDVVATPRDTAIYGVFVQAQAIDAILSSRALVRPAWAVWSEGLAGLAIVLGACAFLPWLRLRAIAGLTVAISAAALGGSWLAFRAGVLIDPAPAVAPAFVAALTMIAILFVEEGRLRARMRANLDKARHEREAATQIQMGMLISRSNLAAVSPLVEVDAVLEPAQDVGGDLYDVFALPGDRLCFLVGDVTGKGVPAALFMALAKALSRTLLMQPHLDLGQAVGAINAELSPNNGQNMQLSLLAGILHADGRLEMCSAGHENPFVVSPDGTVRTLALDGGPTLCAMDDFPYPIEPFQLAPGEILVAYTDGVTEAQDLGHDLFGTERALAAVAAASGPGPLSGLVDALVSAVRDFEAGGEPSDDLTVLALRRAG